MLKVKILNGVWSFIECEEDIFAETHFPKRVVKYSSSIMEDEQLFKHCMVHELTHVYQAELGMWQNVMGNGKMNDEFDCEWIAEFVALYSQSILDTYEEIKHLYKE